jgi:hypothetical protein
VANHRPARSGDHSGRILDVLWVSTVPDHELYPTTDPEHGRPALETRSFDPQESRPVHGTLTVDVRNQSDRVLLERLLRTQAVLSVTAADGWTQRLRLMSVKGVTIEEQADGSSVVVATYAWLAAASNN